MDTCDRHPSARAVDTWTRDGETLTLCGHCTRLHHAALTEQGWRIVATVDA